MATKKVARKATKKAAVALVFINAPVKPTTRARLNKLRTEHGLTQGQLLDKLFAKPITL